MLLMPSLDQVLHYFTAIPHIIQRKTTAQILRMFRVAPLRNMKTPNHPYNSSLGDIEAAEAGQSEFAYEYPDPEESACAKYTASYNAWYEQQTGEILEKFDEEKRGWNNSPFKQEGSDRPRWTKVYWYDEDMEVDEVDEETYHACPPYTKAIKAIHEDYYQAMPSINGGVKWEQTHIYEPWGRGTLGVLKEGANNMGNLTSALSRVFNLESIIDQPYPTREETQQSKGDRLRRARATAPEPEPGERRHKPASITTLHSPNVEFAIDPLLAKYDSEVQACPSSEEHPPTAKCATTLESLERPEYVPTPESLQPHEVLPIPTPRQAMPPPPPPLPPRRTQPDREMCAAIFRGLKFGTQARKPTPKSNNYSMKMQQARRRRIVRNKEKSLYRGWEHRTFDSSPLSMGDGL